MIPDEDFEELRSFLFHLYDPAYKPGASVRAATACRVEDEPECSRNAVLRAIESLRPAPLVPSSSRMNRLYQLLVHRFVLTQTQEETSAILGLTPRHLRREEREAIALLANRLQERTLPSVPGVPGHGQTGPGAGQARSAAEADWSLQLQQELTSLQRSDRGQEADVAEVVYKAVELCRPLGRQRGIELAVDLPGRELHTVVAASVLRQTVVMALEALVACAVGGEIRIGGERKGDAIELRLSSSACDLQTTLNLEKVGALLALQGGTHAVDAASPHVTIRLEVPAWQEKTVLVIDDNEDIIYLYERYVAMTRYRVQRVDARALQLQAMVAAIEVSAPDIIVLDVMMPRMDGWELLTHLHEHPTMRSIPVIVCSIIKGELLAQSLGATHYLAKPVTQEQFLEALELAGASIGARSEAQ